MVSQHLAKLRLADLVSARRVGKRQIYVVDDPHVVALVQQALDHHADLRR
jgi:DNA-binding transcriptional ArsR family regulator